MSCSSVSIAVSPEDHVTDMPGEAANGVPDTDTAGIPKGQPAAGTHLQPKLVEIVTSQRDRFRAR